MRYSMYSASNAAHDAQVAALLNPPPAPVYPTPVLTSVEPPPAALVVPTPVLALVRHGESAGWSTRWTYAQGQLPHATTGKPCAPTQSFAVRFAAHPEGGNSAVAVYRAPVLKGTWQWDGIWVWGPELPFFGWLNIDGLKLFLQLRGTVDKGELDKVRKAAQIRAARAKEKAVESAKNRKNITSKRESGG